MASNIASFLNQSDGAAAKFIKAAEKLCGYPSEDVRLLGEIAANVKDKLSELGLDPNDTTSRELYYAIRAKALADNRKFNQLYGFDKPSDFTARLMEIFQHSYKDTAVFALKKPALRRLLSSLPPKRLMKKLHYRTAESMLKREEPGALCAIALEIESALWKRKFASKAKNLSAADFHDQPIQLIALSRKVSDASRQAIVPAYLSGTVAMNINARFDLSALYSMLRILEAADSVEHWSFAVKQRQLNRDFGKFVSQNLNSGPTALALIGNQPISYNHLRARKFPAEKLADLSPSLTWWKDSGHLAGIQQPVPISLNLHDVLNDQLIQANFKSRQAAHLYSEFWHKLLQKYLKYPNFETQVLRQLNPEPILAEDSDFVESAVQAAAERA